MDFASATLGYTAFKTVKDVGEKARQWAVWIIGLLFALCVVAFSVNVYIGAAVTTLVVIWGLLSVLYLKNTVTDVFGGKTTTIKNTVRGMFRGTKTAHKTAHKTQTHKRRQSRRLY
jgi:hypothetical protein